MDYRSKTSASNFEELLKLLTNKPLQKFQAGGTPDGGVRKYPHGGDHTNGIDPRDAYLMSKDPKSLTRQEKKYLREEYGFHPGFDTYTPEPVDTQVYGNIMSDVDWSGSIFSNRPTSPFGNPNTFTTDPSMGGPETPFGSMQLIKAPPAQVQSNSATNNGGGYNPFTDPRLSDEEYVRMVTSGNVPSESPYPKYTSREEIYKARENKEISTETFSYLIEEFNQKGYATKPENLSGKDSGEDSGEDSGDKREVNPWLKAGMLGYVSPSLSMEGVLHHMGRAIGAPEGTKGRNLQIGLTAADAILKGTRNVFSGIGLSKVNKETRDWYMQQMAKAQRGYYEADAQYDDVNNTGGFSFKYGGVRKYPDGGEHGGEEPEKDPTIRSIFDPRYNEYETLLKRAKALEEYKKWHSNVEKANPQTGSEFRALEAKSDSLAYARQYLPSASGNKEILWTNPRNKTVVRKELDMSPVSNPYNLDIPATPWSGSKNAQEQGDKFRAWVNKEYPDLAKQWSIDAKGNPDNKWVRSAYHELQNEYESSQIPTTKQSVKAKIEERPEGRFAYRSQTVIMPDGSRKLQNVPYYNYTTRESVAAPRVVKVDEQGNIVEEMQKYGGLFGGNKTPKYFAGGFADLGDRAAQVFEMALQAQNSRATSNAPIDNNPIQNNMGNPTLTTPNPNAVGATGAAGGESNYQVGQPVTFKYGGNMVSGVIKKIENGKIYI